MFLIVEEAALNEISSSGRKNSAFDLALKGRGFKPRRKCPQIDRAFSRRGHPQYAWCEREAAEQQRPSLNTLSPNSQRLTIMRSTATTPWLENFGRPHFHST